MKSSAGEQRAQSRAPIVAQVVLLVVAVIVAALLATGGRPASAFLAVAGSPTPTAEWPTAPATSTPRPTRTPTITPGPSPTPTFTPLPTATPTPTPITDIVAVRELGRLETMQYVMQTVVDIANERDTVWERIFGTDQLLLIATGEAIAGFDLTKVAPGDLMVDGQSVTLVLPPPEVFSYFVDEDETYVYQRRDGLFVRLDTELETRARQLAVERLREWALEHDILAKAETAGVNHMEAFLRSLGFTSVTVGVRPGTGQ
jgi:hypothetical protein